MTSPETTFGKGHLINTVRPAATSDLEGIAKITNHYITHSPANFKSDPLEGDALSRWFSEFSQTGRYRLVVAEGESGIDGFACTSAFNARCAYGTSVATTVYVAPDCRRSGVGTRLYHSLFDLLQGEDIHRLYAGITVPNEASVALHKKFGFVEVARFSEAGRKFGKYWDVIWMERPFP